MRVNSMGMCLAEKKKKYAEHAANFTQCGEGVPERTKGYFGSHLGAVSKILHVRLVTAPLKLGILTPSRDTTSKSLPARTQT
jgi:hypothetical protein